MAVVLTPIQALTLTALSAHACREQIAGKSDAEDNFCRHIGALATDGDYALQVRKALEDFVTAISTAAGLDVAEELASFARALES